MTATPGLLLDHQHGVRNTKCDHPDCLAATRRYQKQWRYERQTHGRRTGSTHRVRLHLAALEGAGWSVRAIAEAAGVSATTVSRLRSSSQPTVSRKVAARLLALDPDVPLAKRATPRGFVPKIGTTRRLQALMAMGWSAALIAEQVGESAPWVYNRTCSGGQWVTRDVRDRVERVYRDLSRRIPPERTIAERVAASRARTAASKRGWLTPAAWDADTIDDPYAEPLADDADDDAEIDDDVDVDHAAVERYLASGEKSRQWTHAEGAVIVDRLRRRGESTFQIERRGFKPERYPTHEGKAS